MMFTGYERLRPTPSTPLADRLAYEEIVQRELARGRREKKEIGNRVRRYRDRLQREYRKR